MESVRNLLLDLYNKAFNDNQLCFDHSTAHITAYIKAIFEMVPRTENVALQV